MSPAGQSACPSLANPLERLKGGRPGAAERPAADVALARAFICRFLAKAFEDPAPESWEWLGSEQTQTALRTAWQVAVGRPSAHPFEAGRFEGFHSAYLATFGHAARGPVPLNEIEYGEPKADPLFQPHRLADLAAFYRAFGLELAEDAGERHDHICIELEFLCVLAAKEAYAVTNGLDRARLEQCREAEKKFLQEHLGRWVPAFSRRLAAATDEPSLRALAKLTRAFIETECARFGVTAGSEYLVLRPVDEAGESLCAVCGLNPLPPGALAAT
ncbi:MAG TPA: molecular chaperone TorD family protein [Kiritimatiellia bacterium]|nr:molecular chaperone TorD family protein [Kiritimatiellia bacterium]